MGASGPIWSTLGRSLISLHPIKSDFSLFATVLSQNLLLILIQSLGLYLKMSGEFMSAPDTI